MIKCLDKAAKIKAEYAIGLLEFFNFNIPFHPMTNVYFKIQKTI